MLVKMGIFPKVRGEKKNVWNHHQDIDHTGQPCSNQKHPWMMLDGAVELDTNLSWIYHDPGKSL